MTQELTVAAEFERGTLIQATSDGEYDVSGKDHAYYVPDRARRDAGMQKVRETETEDAYRDDSGLDWDAIEGIVSPMDIVERAEQDLVNRSGGDIGDVRRRGIHRSARGADEHVTVPAGVVKFTDPEADDEGGSRRDPVQRGLLWGALKDKVLVDSSAELQYQNDTQQSAAHTARIPVPVLTEGIETMVAYLAAHDHIDYRIAGDLRLETDEVEEIVEEFASEATA